MLLEPAPVDPTLPIWFGPVVGGVTFLLLALLVYAIATGRRWALILSVALFVIGLPASLPFLQEQSPRALVVSGGQGPGKRRRLRAPLHEDVSPVVPGSARVSEIKVRAA